MADEIRKDDEIVENNEESEEEKLAQENAELESGIVASLEDTELVSEVQNSFLDYAMSVIVARALPDVRDGLKPVHRRVIYGMVDGGYTSDKPFVKSAKIVGDVMGKYHPHGDSAIYGTLVRMAQTFSMRYTLVSGHGNFGSMDGDEAAAMRYTEARMGKLANEMVRDINCDTVPFVPNYDNSLVEPAVLPSRFPNLLVNGSDGIAVGMATKMPPHNLGEIIDGINFLARNPNATTEELMKFVKAPDFPTGGIIYGLSGIREAYETGKGTFKLRAKTEVTIENNGKGRIHITEIPYQVNKADLVAKIGELARDKVIEGITSVKDYSKTDVNIVIETRKDVVPQVVLNQLFKLTKLEVSYGIINLCIVDGAPKVLSLKQLMQRYIDFQMEVIERRTNFLRAKDLARKHIVDALIKVHDILDITKSGKEARDEFIDMATSSASPAEFAERLMKRYEFSEDQAKAIVGMTLGRLTGLETKKLEDERTELIANIEHYDYILSSKEHILDVVLEELNAISKKYNDERKTEVSNIITSVDDEDLIPEEELVITLTEKGYIKRMSTTEFRSQKRGGTGVRGMTVYSDDEVIMTVYSKTHMDVMFFTSYGRVYRKRGHEIPESSRIGKGIPVINLLKLDQNERVVSIINVPEYENHYLFFCTKHGVTKRVALEEFKRINVNGKYAITFKEGDELLDVKVTNGHARILIASDAGKLCMFDEEQVRAMGRTAAGVRGMNLKDEDKIVSISTDLDGDKVFVLSERGLGKLSMIDDYRQTNRGAGGVITIKITEKTGKLIGMKVISGDEDYIVITNNGQVIRSNVSGVRLTGRNASGVKIINLKEEESVVGFAVLPPSKEEEIEGEAAAENSVEGNENAGEPAAENKPEKEEI